MTHRRSFTKSLPLMGDVHILVMSGKQRDEYVQDQILLREDIAAALGLSQDEYNALSVEERASKATEALQKSSSLLQNFNGQQYQLIAWCFATPELEPVFASAEAASEDLDYEQAAELAKACAEVNKLLPEQEKETQLDFFETRKNETGTD